MGLFMTIKVILAFGLIFATRMETTVKGTESDKILANRDVAAR